MGWVNQSVSPPAPLVWLLGFGPWEAQPGLPSLAVCPTHLPTASEHAGPVSLPFGALLCVVRLITRLGLQRKV